MGEEDEDENCLYSTGLSKAGNRTKKKKNPFKVVLATHRCQNADVCAAASCNCTVVGTKEWRSDLRVALNTCGKTSPLMEHTFSFNIPQRCLKAGLTLALGRTSFCGWVGGLALRGRIIRGSTNPNAAVASFLFYAESRSGKELRRHPNATFAPLGQRRPRICLPPGADAGPHVVYLLRRGAVSARVEKNKGSPPPAPPPSNYLLVSPFLGFSSRTSPVTFPSTVAAVKRQRGLLADGEVKGATGSNSAPICPLPQSEAQSRGWSGPNVPAALIGPLYEL